MPYTCSHRRDEVETHNGSYVVSTREVKREYFRQAVKIPNQHWVEIARYKGNQRARETHQDLVKLLATGDQKTIELLAQGENPLSNLN